MSPAQEDFKRNAVAAGAIYLVARSIDDVQVAGLQGAAVSSALCECATCDTTLSVLSHQRHSYAYS